ncbi:hypothetical protein [Treponema sp.]|uniref:hypothetical protein n=1 Tax=Treponema sp. TaxID=166 RepID=UPI0025FC3B63|nr:hypothetical protein [Treponema sp.]MCR5217702.1 hypothetical protein [Treponema sp.]
MNFKQALCIFLTSITAGSGAFSLTTQARAILSGNLAEGTKQEGEDAKYEFFKLNSKAQKDDDGIVIDFSEGSFGGRLALWYEVNSSLQGSSGSNVSFRRSNIWFKPLDSLKITLGYTGCDQLYKERIDEWKVGNPFNLNERDWSKHPGYINYSDVDEMGLGFESRAIEGLVLTGGIARRWGSPGNFGKSFWNKSGDADSTYDAWGLTARYYYNKLCFQAGYRDNGSQSWKVCRAALGYEDNGIYAFAQSCLGIDYKSESDEYELSGICMDLYGEYKVDAWTFIAHLPLTFRLTDEDEDPDYFEYVLEAKYNTGKIANMDSFSPYIKIGSMNHDGDNKYAFIRLNDQLKDSVNFDITPGAEFNIGPCTIDIGYELLIHSKLYTDANNCNKVEWKIPVKAEIKF